MKEIPQASIALRELINGLKEDHFEYLQNLINTYGSIFSFPFKHHTAIVITIPEIIHHILVSNSSNYIKGADVNGTAFHHIKTVLGESILLTDNKNLWAKHRSIVIPKLANINFPEYAKTMAINTQEMIDDWKLRLNVNHSIDISYELQLLTLKNFLHPFFNSSNLNYSKLLEFMEHARASHRDISFKEMIKMFDKVVDDFIQTEINDPNTKDDFLLRFIDAYKDEPDQAKALMIIRDELKGLLLAGHETVSATLVLTLYLLSQAPDIQKEIYKESQAIFQNQIPEFNDLKKLAFTEAVFKEALRLYPPVYTIPRIALDDDISEDFFIPKNSYIMMPIYHLQRETAYWEEPEMFKPQRFLGQGLPEKSQQAYLPFGLGPRACIGRDYAMMEASLVISMLLHHFNFQSHTDEVVELQAAHTLWTKKPVYLNVFNANS